MRYPVPRGEQAKVTGAPDGLDGDDNRRDPPTDRNAVVSELAGQIRDVVRAGRLWRPDYTGLMATTGRKRSWCEKVVHDARSAVLEALLHTDDDDRTDGDAGDIHTDALDAVLVSKGEADRAGRSV
jgi:hypothetical protein